MTPFAATLAALLSLPVAVEDKANEYKPAQYAALAHEIAKVKPPRGIGAKDWRALLIAVGAAETHYALRIMDGRCKPFECDRGRARSSWQLHENLFTRPVWAELHGFTNLHIQVKTADEMLKRSWYQCAGHTRELPVAVQRTVLAFAGKPCDPRATAAIWRGLELRTGYWLKARQAMG